ALCMKQFTNANYSPNTLSPPQPSSSMLSPLAPLSIASTDCRCSVELQQRVGCAPNPQAMAQTIAQLSTYTRLKLFGLPPLFAAVCQTNALAVKLLLNNAALVDITDADGNTCLHIVAAKKTEGAACAAALIEHGAKIFEPNAVGVKPIDLYPDLRNVQ